MNNAVNIEPISGGRNSGAAGFCGSCGFELPKQSKFCPGCGVSLSGAPRGGLIRGGAWKIVVLGALIFGCVYGFSLLTPESPTSAHQPNSMTAEDSDAEVFADEPLRSLKAAADKAPDSVEAQSKLAEALVNKINSVKKPGTSLIFSTLAVLRGLLDLDPKNKNALLSLGDIAFNQAVFDKAASYYSRYLELEPKDLDARVNYGNSLLFIGKSTEALKELGDAFNSSPKDFRIAVSLTVAHIRTGDDKKAAKMRDTAMALAPSPEEKTRLAQFLDSMSKGPQADSPAQQQGGAAASPEDLISSAVSTNPVAGPKFSGVKKLGGGSFEAAFNNFPMEQMPPFAKEKFFASLREKIVGPLAKDIKNIRFVDASTGRPMDSLELGK